MSSYIFARNKRRQRYFGFSHYVITAAIICLAIILLSKLCAFYKTVPATFAYQAVIVKPGDNLWQLACDTGLEIDNRTLVREIIRYNGLSGSYIYPGQTIYIPVALNTTKK